jgi:SAM-dependent methyltransferase
LETTASAVKSSRLHDLTPSLPAIDHWVISFLVLFFELAIIRWIPSNISLLSYFSNVVLISCFLGLGTGCVLKIKRDLLPFLGVVILGLVLLTRYLHQFGIQLPLPGEAYFFGATGKYRWLYVVPVVFLLTSLPFVILGQQLSRSMEQFSPIRGYSINIFGSLAGTSMFALFSFFGKGPTIWFLLAFLLMSWVLKKERNILLINVLLFALSMVVVHQMGKNSIWSPYNKIELQRLRPVELGGIRVIVNEDYHQLILNLTDAVARKYPDLNHFRRTYDIPYDVLSVSQPKVLVLGAGAGNDVAAALRSHAQAVDAVELDRAILELGVVLHPEKPYSDPRVRLYNDDARYFIRTKERTYDAVVLGWLDSHRLFSSLSNVRQDNFVYTVESLQQIRKLLDEKGILFLSFYVGHHWLGEKLFRMIHQAFGYPPKVFAYPAGAFGLDGQTFIIGATPGISIPDNVHGFVNITGKYTGKGAQPPTDDWPYLYYRSRGLTSEYLYTLLLLVCLSAIVVFIALPKGQMIYKEATHFFFLGAGFLLLEVKNITSLALSFGSTWVVTSVVISSLLGMILLANYWVHRRKIFGASYIVWVFLFLSILMAGLWQKHLLPFASPVLHSPLTVLIASLAFLFAGIIFASSFSVTKAPGRSLGFNVLGAVIGGLAEYLSLAIGISGISLVALGFYFFAFLFRPSFSARPAPLV